MTIYDVCIDRQKKYEELYGKNTIVFTMIGDFYEAYCTEDEGYPLRDLTPIVDVNWTRKNEKDKNGCARPISRKAPIMLGFPITSAHKNMKKLADCGFTVVLFDQVDLPDSQKKGHEFAGVFTPGFFEVDGYREESNYIFSVYIAEERQLKGKSLVCLGISMIDVTTGHNIVHETYGKYHDETYALDELNRIFLSYCPKDILLYFQTEGDTKGLIQNFSQYVNLERYSHRIITTEDKLKLVKTEFFKVTYQNTYLNNVFNLSKRLTTGGGESAVELLELERKPYGVVSYLILLEFVREHNERLISCIQHPSVYCRDRHLILGNDAIQQLNVVGSNNLITINKRYECLFDVIDETVTPMGKRFLRESVINPLSAEKKDEIRRRYSEIGIVKADSEKIIKSLKGVRDTERWHRKMLTGKLTPSEFLLVHTSYENLKMTLFHVRKNKEIQKIVDRYGFVEGWSEMVMNYTKLFNLDKMRDIRPHIPVDSFYNPGNHAMIDKLQTEINVGKGMAIKVREKISQLVGKDINIHFKKKDGYYCNIPRSKRDDLENKLKEGINIRVEDIDIHLDCKKFSFRQMGSYDQIYIELPKKKTEAQITVKREILSKMVMRQFREDTIKLYNDYGKQLTKLDQFVAYFDFIVSGSIIATKYSYCCPEIIDNDGSFISCSQLRHPIIERINIETEYIPHDIDLGNINNKNGILIYGLNSAGKSSLMKAIGLSIILAQMGYYVPAKSFKYQPYMALYARITGNDNIFKRMSSFGVEMTELNAIIRRVSIDGPDTLIIGDEICRGTEQTSGIAIVTTAIKRLATSGASFVLASHLHKIVEQEEFKAISNVRINHIRVDYDDRTSKLIFHRRLVPGEGPKDYGINVAKNFIQDQEFITDAMVIKNRLLGGEETVSKYNSNLPKIRCELCNYEPKKGDKELETHHLHHQKDCHPNGKMEGKEHIHKNHLSNLIILCRPCHLFFHNCAPQISEIRDTNRGREVIINKTKANLI